MKSVSILSVSLPKHRYEYKIPLVLKYPSSDTFHTWTSRHKIAGSSHQSETVFGSSLFGTNSSVQLLFAWSNLEGYNGSVCSLSIQLTVDHNNNIIRNISTESNRVKYVNILAECYLRTCPLGATVLNKLVNDVIIEDRAWKWRW